MRNALLVIALIGLLPLPSLAQAVGQVAFEHPTNGGLTESVWYGQPSLGVDAAGVALLASGVLMEAVEPAGASMAYRGGADNLEGAGMAVLGLGAPLLHLLHGRPKRAGVSFVARVATFSGVIFARESTSDLAPQLLFSALFLAVIVADDAWLARDEVTREPVANAGRGVTGLSPWVNLKQGGGGLALSGAF